MGHYDMDIHCEKCNKYMYSTYDEISETVCDDCGRHEGNLTRDQINGSIVSSFSDTDLSPHFERFDRIVAAFRGAAYGTRNLEVINKAIDSLKDILSEEMK